jgi:hypothetical protein
MVEETASTFIVRTSNRLVVSLVYFDSEPRRSSLNLTKDEATRVAATPPGCRICSIRKKRADPTRGGQL